jgi:hypothetical protein
MIQKRCIARWETSVRQLWHHLHHHILACEDRPYSAFFRQHDSLQAALM